MPKTEKTSIIIVLLRRFTILLQLLRISQLRSSRHYTENKIQRFKTHQTTQLVNILARLG